VFIVGCEDGILPHERSQENDDEIEEERRLLFVGITRAQENLQLSRAVSRFKRGAFWPAIASRFLLELPRAEMQVVEPAHMDQPSPDDFEHDQQVPFEVDPWLHEGIQVGDSEHATSGAAAGAEIFDTSSTNNQRTEEKNTLPNFPRLMTGAELAEQGAARVHPSKFQVGMRVSHKEYGEGTIVTLSGNNLKRNATIEFDELGSKNFRLAFCNLQIIDPA
jgi:DNA helicase-2/ATP-dependent DNA helicase PcrA